MDGVFLTSHYVSTRVGSRVTSREKSQSETFFPCLFGLVDTNHVFHYDAQKSFQFPTVSLTCANGLLRVFVFMKKSIVSV